MRPSPPTPSAFARHELEAAGFVGWRPWSALRATGLADVPSEPGSYVIYREAADTPSFLQVGSGGHFKQRDPNVSTGRLAADWVPGAQVVYIGKATRLRSRLRTYAQFGAGRPAAHWGGRYIWQIPDASDLLVAWRRLATAEFARADEVLLLARFQELHNGNRPFANLTG